MGYDFRKFVKKDRAHTWHSLEELDQVCRQVAERPGIDGLPRLA